MAEESYVRSKRATCDQKEPLAIEEKIYQNICVTFMKNLNLFSPFAQKMLQPAK